MPMGRHLAQAADRCCAQTTAWIDRWQKLLDQGLEVCEGEAEGQLTMQQQQQQQASSPVILACRHFEHLTSDRCGAVGCLVQAEVPGVKAQQRAVLAVGQRLHALTLTADSGMSRTAERCGICTLLHRAVWLRAVIRGGPPGCFPWSW